MATKKRERHWFIIRVVGDPEILALVSGFSIDHVQRQEPLGKGTFLIQMARRWHLSKVFSGLPIFYDYATRYGPEEVESHVPNAFNMIADDSCPLVMVLS